MNSNQFAWMMMSLTFTLCWKVLEYSARILWLMCVALVNLIKWSIRQYGYHADLKDYKGLATLREVATLCSEGAVCLGQYTTAQGYPQQTLQLSDYLLQRHVAVIGPSGAGKSSNLMEPWTMQLLRQGNSVVVVDVKGDLFERLGTPACQEGYRVWYWNPGDNNYSDSWNFLAEIQESRDIEAAVNSILGRRNPADPQPFFRDRDQRWLRALIDIVKEVYGAAATPQTLAELIARQDLLRQLFEQYPQIYCHYSSLSDLLQFQLDEHSKAISGLLNALHLFSTDKVQPFTQHSDFQLSALADQPTLLIVGATLGKQEVATTLSSLMISQLFNQVYRRFEQGASSALRPIYFLLDEAGRLKDRIDFEEILSVARSAKVGVCLAFQDINQMGDPQRCSMILSNCQTLMLLQGCSADTARYFSGRLGERQSANVQYTYQQHTLEPFGSSSHSTQKEIVPVLRDREIMYLPFQNYGAVVQVREVSPKPFLVSF